MSSPLDPLVAAIVDGVAARLDRDPRGKLIPLSEGWGCVKPSTLARWSRTGRLKAFRLERRKLAAWESSIREAVEAAPIEPKTEASNGDALAEALATGELVVLDGGRR